MFSGIMESLKLVADSGASYLRIRFALYGRVGPLGILL